jgi:hypothetical protein
VPNILRKPAFSPHFLCKVAGPRMAQPADRPSLRRATTVPVTVFGCRSVRISPGRLASQLEASLAGMVATSFLKRRQQVLKPRGGLDMKVRRSLVSGIAGASSTAPFLYGDNQRPGRAALGDFYHSGSKSRAGGAGLASIFIWNPNSDYATARVPSARQLQLAEGGQLQCLSVARRIRPVSNHVDRSERAFTEAVEYKKSRSC